MDFRAPHTVGERIDDKFQQLIFGAGYDHCYVLNKMESGSLDLAATCKDPESGRIMEVYTTEAGVQLYMELHSLQEALSALKHSVSRIPRTNRISHRLLCCRVMNTNRSLSTSLQ
jgi:hypothetical protein